MKKLLSIFIFLSSTVLSTYCMETPFEVRKKYITEIQNEAKTPFSIIVYLDPMQSGAPLNIQPDETAAAAHKEGNPELFWEKVEEAENEKKENLKNQGSKYEISENGIISKKGKNLEQIDVTEFSRTNIIEVEIPSLKKVETFKDDNFYRKSRLIIDKNGNIQIEEIR